MLDTRRPARLLVPAPSPRQEVGRVVELSVMEQRYQAVLAACRTAGRSSRSPIGWASRPRPEQVGLVSVAGRKLKAIGSPRKENCVPEILL
jgi:hypothetical protein